MIRAFEPRDLDATVALFQRSVREVGRRDYSSAEVAAWAPECPDLQAWRRRLGTGGVFVFEQGHHLLGFARIDENGYLDLLYVHPDAQRRGVAAALLGRAISWAAARGIRSLHSDVSLTARPFFERSGFRIVREQTVERQGVSLRNFRMEYDIDAGPPPGPEATQPARGDTPVRTFP